MQKMNVLTDKNCNGKFLNIGDKFYFRPDKDYSKDWIMNYICSKYNIDTDDMRIIFKSDTKNLGIKYNHHPDLYILFHNFEDFKNWYKKNNVSVFKKISQHKDIDIRDCKKHILNYINEHFESQQGNVFLLKIKFNKNDVSDFIF